MKMDGNFALKINKLNNVNLSIRYFICFNFVLFDNEL